MDVLYIHGFNSSPDSFKARLLGRCMERRGQAGRLLVPALSDLPDRALATLEAWVAGSKGRPVGLIGSSLGGYYATFLAQRYGLRAVLVNPAVRPYDLLEDYLGPQQNLYTGERYHLTPEHIDALRALDVECITHPERFLLLVQTGDQTLDYREALARFPRSPRIVVAGGSHGFENFDRFMGQVLDFLGLPPPARPGAESACIRQSLTR